MAINTESVTVAVCDGCGQRTYGAPNEKPEVLSGKVTDRTGRDAVSAEWSACRPQHVGKAAIEALNAAREAQKNGRSANAAWPASSHVSNIAG